MPADLRNTVITIAVLAEEAGVSADEMASITVIEFAVRLMLSRRRRAAEALAIVASEQGVQ